MNADKSTFKTIATHKNVIYIDDTFIKVLDSSGFSVGDIIRNDRTKELMQVLDVIDSEDMIEVERFLFTDVDDETIEHGDILMKVEIDE